MKKLGFLYLLFLFSCRTQLELSDFMYNQTSTLQLPKLKITYNEEGMKRSFQLYRNEVHFTSDSSFVQTRLIPVVEQGYIRSYHDTKIFLENSINKQGSNGNYDGVAEWNVPVFIETVTSNTPVLALTFGISYLLGLPTFVYHNEIQLTLQIKNEAGEIIKNYSAIGIGRASVNLYYGLRNSDDASRKAYLLALKDSYRQILQDLTIDQQYLLDEIKK